MRKNILVLLLSVVFVVFTGCNGGNEEKSSDTLNVNSQTQNSSTSSSEKLSANINADKTTIVAGQSISFDTTGTITGDSKITRYEWLDDQGNVSSTDQNFNRSFATAGTYTQTLKITNDKGETSKHSITIRVIEKVDTSTPNIPPIAKAQISESEIFVGDGVRFTSYGSSDSDGKIISYEWRDMDGILLSTEASFSRGFPYAGTYKKTLTVTDNRGATHSASVTLVVKERLNIPPVANAGVDKTINEGESVTLDGSGSSDSDGSIVEYKWSEGAVVHCANSITCKIDNLSVGNHSITLSVTDNRGATHSANVTLVVKEVPLVSLNLSSSQNIAGYEVELKFTKALPSNSDLTLDSSFLKINGRTVGDLEPDIKISEKTIKFGAYSYGSQNGVSGSFNILTINTMDSLSDISILKKICVDKDANIVDCILKIEK